MITLIYGEDIAASRSYYLTQREKNLDKVILEGNVLTVTDFLQAVSGTGLFGDRKTIFIEELLSKRKPSKELDAIILSIQSFISNDQLSIILWESKEPTPKQLAPFKGATINQFKTPQTVFAFLDSIAPNNGKKMIILFHDLLKNEDVNFALFMLQRQIRMLLFLHTANEQGTNVVDSIQNAISEVSRLAPWQKGKIEKQANAFTMAQLCTLHEHLYQLELGQKTGILPQPVENAIDFLLLSM